MISISATLSIRKVADRFKNCFSNLDEKTNYGSLCALFCLHLFNLKNISETVRFLSWAPSVSSISDATKKFSSNRFMRRLQSSILLKLKDKLNEDDFCFVIDDTSNQKYGKHTYGFGKWKTSSKGIYSGQKIIVLALINKTTGYAIPLHYFICLNKDHPDHVPGHDLAVHLG